MEFRVRDWLIRPELNLCQRGEETVRLTPKAMELLVCLARRRGDVATKEAIFNEVWNGTFVSDDSLTRAVGELRRALQDNAREPSIIETVSKRGYRIVAPIAFPEPVPAPSLSPPRLSSRRRTRIIAGCGAVLLLAVLAVMGAGRLRRVLVASPPAVDRIAVLPLQNLSADREQDYFVDGMTDELITELAKVNSWQVISRTSMMRYKGTRKSVPEIAHDLGAHAVIEGTVLRSGAKVRITVQLIDAATDVHRWSGSFEGNLGDVVSLQGRIARSIANELAVVVQSPPGQPRRAPRIAPDAYDAYLRAWHFFNNRQMAKAAQYFEAAAQKEPGFALAHAMLYEAEGMVCYGRDVPLSDRALTAMRRALELDENLSEVHTDLGDYKFYWQWDWEGGMSEYRRAVELDRGSVDTALHYAGGLMHLGHWDESVREFRRALHLDPFSRLLNDAILTALVNAHRYEEALAQFRLTIELAPNQPSAWRHAAAAYARLGRDAEAIEATLRADRFEGPEAWDADALRRAADAGGLSGIAKERLRQAKLRRDADRWPPVRWAILYAGAGKIDEAFRMLEAAYSRHSPQLAWIKCSYGYDPLRSDPRFGSLLRRMRFP